MKLIQSTLFALSMALVAPAMACECGSACAKGKDNKMACEKGGKTCGCGEKDKDGNTKACSCDKSKKAS